MLIVRDQAGDFRPFGNQARKHMRFSNENIPVRDGDRGVLVRSGRASFVRLLHNFANFRLAKYREVNPVLRSVVLLLPKPKVISARVNHASRDKGGSYFYEVTSHGIEPIIPGAANRTKAINSALNKAPSSCASADVLATARKNAEEILVPLFSANEWNVSIQWGD